ncbi:acylphosphatase [Cognatiluteimonas profundi]|uniref:acylphosphatase n=1 Tax=Cognatiluteimonas profundi TaxID=2594501 RepID=UPI00131B1F71|nr:acylphosphatase [Lysobacter profundi]
MDAAARFIVVGKVQGVCFRASTQQQARRLHLNGHARNLPDGCVEVLACGSEDALDQLEHWLRRGPPMARVDAVERQPAAIPAGSIDADAFHVR